MTKVTVDIIDENRFQIRISGHSEHSKNGEPDIVCSACSALAYTLQNAVRKMDANKLLSWEWDSDNDGSMELDFDVRSREPYIAKAEAIVQTIVDGYRLLEEKYPDNVQVRVHIK